MECQQGFFRNSICTEKKSNLAILRESDLFGMVKSSVTVSMAPTIGDQKVTSWITWNTLPETNISPENRPLEKEIPIGNHHF